MQISSQNTLFTRMLRFPSLIHLKLAFGSNIIYSLGKTYDKG